MCRKVLHASIIVSLQDNVMLSPLAGARHDIVSGKHDKNPQEPSSVGQHADLSAGHRKPLQSSNSSSLILYASVSMHPR